MNAQQQELFDLAILRLLDANRSRYGLGVTAICHLLPQFGFTSSHFKSEDQFASTVADRIEYLTNKRLVEEVLKNVNKANRAWRITEDGINHVDR